MSPKPVSSVHQRGCLRLVSLCWYFSESGHFCRALVRQSLEHQHQAMGLGWRSLLLCSTAALGLSTEREDRPTRKSACSILYWTFMESVFFFI